MDAVQLQHILNNSQNTFSRSIRSFGTIGGSAPSLDLCRALLALRDPGLGGRLAIEHVPALITLLKFWKTAFRRCGPSGALSLRRGSWTAKVSSYAFRGLLWAGGATASNKVLEALVGRFARNKQITLEGYLMSMSRIHLAHGKYTNYRILYKMN